MFQFVDRDVVASGKLRQKGIDQIVDDMESGFVIVYVSAKIQVCGSSRHDDNTLTLFNPGL
eukprot:693256-Prorocentrum_minimum.AAC.28